MEKNALLPTYKERLEAFRKSDAERDALVTEIMKNYEAMSLKLHEALDDLSNEKQSRRRWQNLASEREQQLQEHKQVSGSNNFVMAVIDGDGAVFKDSLYAMGKDGGSEAAHQLKAEIQSHLRKTYPEANVSDWGIVVHIFLNFQGLGSKLLSCGIINAPNDLLSFGRSFGITQPLFNFVDVGNGKERADHKIRETLRLYMPISQCKHVFFAPCHDNGYLPVLEAYRRDSAMASRLTLIETRPAEPGFLELGLKRIRMPDIFRADNLPNTRPSTGFAPPVAALLHSAGGANGPMSARPASPAPSTDSNAALNSNATSWATVGKKSPANKTISIAPAQTPKRAFVLLNVDDHRLDQDLPRTDGAAEYRFLEKIKKNGKFCNSYHLQGTCPMGKYCDYVHGERITSPGEILVLKHKARNLSCPQRGDCRDPGCIFGHICRFGKNCRPDSCYFGYTHHIDLEPAKRAFEDGSEEWLPTYLKRS